MKTHPDYDEVVRSIGFGVRKNTLIALLHNGDWFELEFLEIAPDKVRLDYWGVGKPDSYAQKLLDFLNDKHTRN